MFLYYKCYISIELTFLNELMLRKQVYPKECDICHYWYFLNKGFEPLAILLFKVHIRSADYRY